jgi:hypothetical protein
MGVSCSPLSLKNPEILLHRIEIQAKRCLRRFLQAYLVLRVSESPVSVVDIVSFWTAVQTVVEYTTDNRHNGFDVR